VFGVRRRRHRAGLLRRQGASIRAHLRIEITVACRSPQSFLALPAFELFHGLIVKAGLETSPELEAVGVAMFAANEA
jgi:hypothetical protein